MVISHIIEELTTGESGIISKKILSNLLKEESVWQRAKYKELISEHYSNQDYFGPNNITSLAVDKGNEFIHSIAGNRVEEFINSVIEEISKLPEIVDVDLGFDLVAGSMEEIENVMSNMLGIDLPEGLDFLPGASELVLGIRLLMDIKAVNKEFVGMPNDQKKNIMAAKALVTLSKFGVTTTLTSVGAITGGAIGVHFAGIGAAVTGPIGAIAGGFVAREINKTIAPHAQEISYQLLNLNKDDIFYFKNKNRIDDIGLKLLNTKNRLREELI